MTDKVLAWMRAQRMTHPGDTVVCAVSGGADSVCMLHVLVSLRETLSVTIEAAHYNHHLRGAESDRDEAFVSELCKLLNVPLHRGGGDVRARMAQTHESAEEAARRLRYGFFDSLPGLVATAHTQDDNLETILLNLTRGTGLAGLCGIPPVRGRIVRPMLPVSRAEIERYLDAHGLRYVTDSTNLTPDMRRNRIRQTVVPLLRQENPAIGQTALRMSGLLREDEAFLQQLADEALRAAQTDGGVLIAPLRAQPAPIRTRAMRALLSAIHAPKLSQRHIAAVDALLFTSDPSASVSLPGGYTARREYDRLLLAPAGEPAAFSPAVLRIGGCVRLEAAGLCVRCVRAENSSQFQNSPSTFVVKYDTIEHHPELIVRPRQAHDAMRVRGGRKTLKKLLIEQKIPARERGLLPVVADGRGVLGVYTIGVDLDRAAAPGEPALVITIEKEKEEQAYDQQI